MHEKLESVFQNVQKWKDELQHATMQYEEAVRLNDEVLITMTKELVDHFQGLLQRDEKEYWAYQSDLEWMAAHRHCS